MLKGSIHGDAHNKQEYARNTNHVQAETNRVSQARNPTYTNRSRDHECPVTTVSNFMSARWRDWHCPELNCSKIIPALEQGLSVPSAEANKPATLYLALAASNTPLGLPACVLFALHAITHAPTRTKSGTPPSTPTRTGDDAHTHIHSHECTLARRPRGALTYETVGAATPWRREQRISATKASKRRPSTRCKRKAKLRLI